MTLYPIICILFLSKKEFLKASYCEEEQIQAMVDIMRILAKQTTYYFFLIFNDF